MSEEMDMPQHPEMSDDALDRLLSGAFRAQPFDAKLASRISAAARAMPPAADREGIRGERAGDRTPAADLAPSAPGRVAPAGASPARPARPGRAREPQAAARPPIASSRLNARAFAIAAGFIVAVGATIHLFSSGETERHAPALEVASVTVDADAGALVIRPGDSGYASPGRRVALHEGDRVRAERRSVAIAFADGSEVRIRPETTLEVRQGEVEIIGEAGELYASVTPRAPGAPAFRVAAPGGVEVAVIGTRFGVRVDGGDVLATVAEGVIQMQPRGEGRLPAAALSRAPFSPSRAAAGEQLALSGKRAEPLRRAVDVEATLAWALGAKVHPTEPPVAAPASVTTSAPPPAHPSGPVPATPSSGGDLPIGGSSEPGSDR